MLSETEKLNKLRNEVRKEFVMSIQNYQHLMVIKPGYTTRDVIADAHKSATTFYFNRCKTLGFDPPPPLDDPWLTATAQEFINGRKLDTDRKELENKWLEYKRNLKKERDSEISKYIEKIRAAGYKVKLTEDTYEIAKDLSLKQLLKLIRAKGYKVTELVALEEEAEEGEPKDDTN